MPIFTDSKYGACIKLPSANSGFLEALYKHHLNKKDGSCDSLVSPPRLHLWDAHAVPHDNVKAWRAAWKSLQCYLEESPRGQLLSEALQTSLAFTIERRLTCVTFIKILCR